MRASVAGTGFEPLFAKFAFKDGKLRRPTNWTTRQTSTQSLTRGSDLLLSKFYVPIGHEAFYLEIWPKNQSIFQILLRREKPKV